MQSLDELPKHHFGAILADPPWSYKVYSGKGKKRSADRYYATDSTENICKLPVGILASKDCALFLWATNPNLPDALKVIDAWGFTYKTVAFTWAKTSRSSTPTWAPRWHIGLGYWTRSNSELCLFASRGKPKRLHKDVRQLIVEPIREHSRKPDRITRDIQRLVGGPYLELFARQKRSGWTVWGNETNKFAGE